MSDRKTHAEVVRVLKDGIRQNAHDDLRRQLEYFYRTEDGMRAAHLAMNDFVNDFVAREWTKYWADEPRSAAARRIRDEIARDLDAFRGLNMSVHL